MSKKSVDSKKTKKTRSVTSVCLPLGILIVLGVFGLPLAYSLYYKMNYWELYANLSLNVLYLALKYIGIFLIVCGVMFGLLYNKLLVYAKSVNSKSKNNKDQK